MWWNFGEDLTLPSVRRPGVEYTDGFTVPISLVIKVLFGKIPDYVGAALQAPCSTASRE